jgi:hypothetical protein
MLTTLPRDNIRHNDSPSSALSSVLNASVSKKPATLVDKETLSVTWMQAAAILRLSGSQTRFHEYLHKHVFGSLVRGRPPSKAWRVGGNSSPNSPPANIFPSPFQRPAMRSIASFSLLVLSAVTGALSNPTLLETITGDNFLSKFDHQAIADPTHGRVYVEASCHRKIYHSYTHL